MQVSGYCNIDHENLRPPLHCPADATLFIFDFCGTLFRSNTTKDYLTFLNRKRSIPYKIKHYLYWIIAKFLKDLKIISPNGYIKIRIKTLRGLSEEYLGIQAKAFVYKALPKKANHEVLELLVRQKRMGKNPVILSNTLILLLEPFADKYGIKSFYGSELEFDSHDRCSGKFKTLLASSGKLECLRLHYPDSIIKQACFITDDPVADQDLFNYVKYARVVS